MRLLDYDGDGDAGENRKAELDGMAATLLSALHDVGGLCYARETDRYFFTLAEGGEPVCSPDEARLPNRFTAWTPELLAAANNFQLSQLEPGAWVHNFDYVGQLLFDSVEALTESGQGLIRP